MASSPRTAAQQSFIDGYRDLFPESVTVGQADQDILDGTRELCAEIRARGVEGYKNYIVQDTTGDDARASLTALVDLADRTVC